MLASNRVYTFGRNSDGETGINKKNLTHVDKPFLIPNIEQAKSVTCGFYCTFIHGQDGRVFAFGENLFGTCGVNSNEMNILEPTEIAMDCKNLKSIACSRFNTFFLFRK